MHALVLLPFLLAAPPRVAEPAVRPGDELVFLGESVEANLRVEPPTRRHVLLETRCFVLAVRGTTIDVAALTLARVQDDAAIAKVAVEVTGAAKTPSKSPPAVRLELLRYEAGTSPVLLVPALAPPPMILTEHTATVPLTALEPVLWPMRPKGGAKPGDAWSEPATKALPAVAWKALPPILLDGAEAIEFRGEQVSDKWEKPSGADRPWSRTQRVWLSPADGAVRVVWQRVERKEGPFVATRTETRLDGKPVVAHRGESFERVKREIEFAWWFDQEAAAAKGDDRAVLAARIRRYCEDYPATPFREAVEAVARRVRQK